MYLLRYLKKTEKVGILFPKCNSGDLVSYSNTDRCRDEDARRSRTGVLTTFVEDSVVSICKLQSAPATSRTEAKFAALTIPVRKNVWLRSIVSEFLKSKSKKPVTVY